MRFGEWVCARLLFAAESVLVRLCTSEPGLVTDSLESLEECTTLPLVVLSLLSGGPAPALQKMSCMVRDGGTLPGHQPLWPKTNIAMCV